MPTFSSQIVLSAGAQAQGVAGIDNSIIKGSLKTYASYEALQAESISRLSTDQIAYVKDTGIWYVVTVTDPDYINTFEPSVSFTQFNGFPQTGTGGIFEQTGSFYSTTNDLQITGSLNLSLDGISDSFSVTVDGSEKMKMTGDGILQLMAQEAPLEPVAGGIVYSSRGEFYIGM